MGNGQTSMGIDDVQLTAILAEQDKPSDIASGRTFSCAYTPRVNELNEADVRALYCWGRNDQGQLGNGTRNDSASPTLVDF